MKKKSKSSILLRICILFTLVTILSSLTIIWLASTKDGGFSKWNWSIGKLENVVITGSTPEIARTTPATPNISTTSTTTVAPIRAGVPISKNSPVSSKIIHFIHIPKCGGTTMTTLLRQMQCSADPVNNADCCLNPGFCDWHAHRRCSTIQGCINHFPNRLLTFCFQFVCNSFLTSIYPCASEKETYLQIHAVHRGGEGAHIQVGIYNLTRPMPSMN